MAHAIFRLLSRTLARLPLDDPRRDRLKALVYRRAGRLFERSPNYHDWKRAHPDLAPRTRWPRLEGPPDEAWLGLAEVPARRVEGEPFVVVPVHRGEAETLACIHAARATAPAARIVVVDDATPERRLARRLEERAREGHFELLRNDRNLGYLGSVERGIGFDPTADVVLLNSDCVVHGDWLERLRAAAYSAADWGTVTPLSNCGDIASYPHPQHDQRARLECSLEELDRLAETVNRGLVVEAPTGVGFCLYVKRACLDSVGGFGDVFTAGYGEENDFACRASAAGWRHGLAADVVVRHEGARSFGFRAVGLRRKAASELEARYPDFPARVDEFVSADPLREARERLDAARLHAAAAGDEGAVLLVTHAWGGGVEVHLREFARRYEAEGWSVFVLRFIGEPASPRLRFEPSPGRPRLEDLGALGEVEMGEVEKLGPLIRILRVERVHFHHSGAGGARGAAFVARLAKVHGLPLEATIHDYGCFCPRLHLEGEDGRYCGEPDVEGCGRCLQERGHRFAGRGGLFDLDGYRADYASLLGQAEVVACPTNDVRRRLDCRLEGAALTVCPLPESPLPGPPVEIRERSRARARRWQGGETLRVLVPGALNEQKGARVLFEVAEVARRKRMPLEFRIVGYAREFEKARRAGIRSTGRYEPEDADRILASEVRAPCLVWIPSVAPETWSATLSSALRLGLFPVSFDLGALAERIEEAGRGAVLPLALVDEPERLAEALLALRDEPGTRPGPGPVEPVCNERAGPARSWRPAPLRGRSASEEGGART